MKRSCCDRHHADGLSRRGFLGASLGGALGLALSGGGLLGGARTARAQERPAKGPAGFGGADRCIVLWLNGGPSQLETFDPKPGTANGGPTQAIDTAAPGIQLAATLPLLAEQMQDVALIRGMSTGEGNHLRARYFLHTGYVPSGTVRHPDLGAIICQQKADPGSDMPAYVAVGGATPGAGILGVRFAPFSVQDPRNPVADLTYARDVDAARFARRRELLSQLGRGFAASRPGPETEGHEAVYDKADRMMHSRHVKAFSLDEEGAALRDAYGRGTFGQGCLMARRLVEAGVKVVEVQLGGWDTHQDNFGRTTQLNRELDAGFATLLRDLRERELLSRTLVLCLGEFGRTPKINPNEGRDHFARAWSLALAGGPVRGGRVIGATSADGMTVAERPVSAPDLVASVAHAMGLDREHTNYTRAGRPLSVVPADGKVVTELFAA